MKRGITFLVVMGVMVLSSCSKKESTETPKTGAEATTPPAENARGATGERSACLCSSEKWQQAAGHHRRQYANGYGCRRR